MTDRPRGDPAVARELSFRRFSTLPDIEVMTGWQVKHRFSRHFHDSLTIAFIQDGLERCWSRGATREFAKGDVALFNPGDTHDGMPGADCGWTYTVFYVPTRLAEDFLGVEDVVFEEVATRSPHVVTAMNQVMACIDNEDSTLAQESMIELLYQLVKSRGVLSQDQFCARNARDLIDQDHFASGTVSAWAQSVGVSAEHLVRSFKKAYGITPHAYRQARRSELARSMLRGRKSLVDIALTLGFYDQSHFTKWFVSTQGVSPKRYRSAVR